MLVIISMRSHSEGSRDTETNDVEITGINYILKYIQIYKYNSQYNYNVFILIK